MDGSDPSCSNWLRFINCARNEEEQNMEAYQYHGEIYYLTFKAVYPGNELMVWYGEKYAEELGISVQYTGKYKNYKLYYTEERLFWTLLCQKKLFIIDIYNYILISVVIMYYNIWNSTSCAD